MQSFDEAFDISLGDIAEATVESVEQGSVQPLIDLFFGSGDTGGGGGGGGTTGSSSGRRDHDYHGDFNFIVEIDGLEAGAFQKCDGLSWETDLIEYRDSMDPYPRYRPGIRRFGKLKLTKGYIKNSALWDWCQSVMNGKHDRKNGAVHLYADDGGTLEVTYNFIDAFPIKWSGFKLDGKGTAGLVEEIELAVESVAKA